MGEQVASTGLYERADAASSHSLRTSETPRVAVVLGSGLGGFADDFEDAVESRMKTYRAFPVYCTGARQETSSREDRSSSVTCNAGTCALLRRLLAGANAFPIPANVAEVVKVLRQLNTDNAAGGIDVELSQGALMVLVII